MWRNFSYCNSLKLKLKLKLKINLATITVTISPNSYPVKFQALHATSKYWITYELALNIRCICGLCIVNSEYSILYIVKMEWCGDVHVNQSRREIFCQKPGYAVAYRLKRAFTGQVHRTVFSIIKNSCSYTCVSLSGST